jgi:streptogramin lyase
VRPLEDVASLKLDLEGGPDWPTELDGSLWLLAPDVALMSEADEPFVYRIDPESGEVLEQITVGGRLCQGMSAGFDALWVCADDGVLRIDPATNAVVARVAFTTPRVFTRLAVSDSAVFSLAGSVVADSVVRIDPASDTVAATYELGRTATPLGHVDPSLAYGAGALWLTLPADGLLLRIDPETGEVTTAASDLPGPSTVAAGAGGIWVLLYGDDDAGAVDEPALLFLDPASGETTLFDAGSSPGGSGDLAVSADAVWVRGDNPFLVRLDPRGGELIEQISKAGTGDGAVGTTDGFLWVTSLDRGSVWRIDL